MLRAGLLLVLLQGGLLTVLANDVTTVAPVGKKHSLQNGIDEPPRYELANAAGQPCVIMEMDAHVSFKWEIEPNKTKELDTYVESKDVKTSGYCKNDVQLSLTWKSVLMKWTFEKTRDSAKWFAKEVEVQYTNMQKKENNISGPSTVSTWTSRDVLLFSAPIGKAFHCAEEYSLHLNGSGNDSATLLLRRFRVQPFVSGSAFGPSHCPTEINNGVSVPVTATPSSSSKPDTSSVANHHLSQTPTQTIVRSEKMSSSTPHSSTDYLHSTSSNTDLNKSGSTMRPTGSSMPGLASSQRDHSSTERPMSTTPHSNSALISSTTSFPQYVYQKTSQSSMKMPVYPPKKMFYTGVKMNNNDALSSMLWSWYSSGFYTGYYQALQQNKNTLEEVK